MQYRGRTRPRKPPRHGTHPPDEKDGAAHGARARLSANMRLDGGRIVTGGTDSAGTPGPWAACVTAVWLVALTAAAAGCACDGDRPAAPAAAITRRAEFVFQRD